MAIKERRIVLPSFALLCKLTFRSCVETQAHNCLLGRDFAGKLSTFLPCICGVEGGRSAIASSRHNLALATVVPVSAGLLPSLGLIATSRRSTGECSDCHPSSRRLKRPSIEALLGEA